MMSIGSLGTIGVSLIIRLSGLIRRGLWCRIGTRVLRSIGAMVPRVTICSRDEGGFGKGDEKEKELQNSHC